MLVSWVRPAAIVAALSVSLLAACDSPTGPSESIILTSQAALDGGARGNGTAVANGGQPFTGDQDETTPGVGSRQFYSFDLSVIPGTAEIESATLRIYQAEVVGTPYDSHGDVIVDRVDLGVGLDAGDYGAAALTGNIGTLSTSAAIDYKALDVTNAVRTDRNAGRTASQFRIRFSRFDTNNNGVSNYVRFTDAEDSCCSVAKPPELVIEYVDDEDDD